MGRMYFNTDANVAKVNVTTFFDANRVVVNETTFFDASMAAVNETIFLNAIWLRSLRPPRPQ